MGKPFFYLLFFFVCFCSYAQTSTVYGFGNTYTYGEKDSIREGDFAVTYLESNGRIYAKSFTGGAYIIGSNSTKKIKFPDSTQIPDAYFTSTALNGALYLFGSGYVYRLKNDTVLLAIKMPPGLITTHKMDNTIYLGTALKGRFITYQFSEGNFITLYNLPLLPGILSDVVFGKNGTAYRVDYYHRKWSFSKLINKTKAEFAFSVSINEPPLTNIDFISENEWYAQSAKAVYHFNKERLIESAPNNNALTIENAHQYFLNEINQNIQGITPKNNLHNTIAYISSAEKIMSVLYDSIQHNYYVGSFNKPFRFFPYLKKYPTVFNGTSAANIHALTQDNKNRVWVASYDGNLAVLESNKASTKRQTGLGFLPGAVSIGSYNYFIGEGLDYGLLQYDNTGNKKSLTKNLNGFYQYISLDNIRYYFGAGDYKGLWLSTVNNLQSAKPNWQVIDSTKGNYIQNIITITEDKKHRVWLGQGSKGWAVYYPEKQKAVTRLIAKNETSFGIAASAADATGTVWLGTLQYALLYYDDYRSDIVDPSQIKKIQHPLLPDGLKIRQLKIWNNWLLIGAQGKMLLLDLNEWYQHKKVLLRYLNPQEANLAAELEQNAILTDKRDSSVWFATTDMLYQWDIKTWLSLPTYKVIPDLLLSTGDKQQILKENANINIAPTKNSLHITIRFQSRDNMPRYMSVAFLKKSDSLVFAQPNLQTTYNFSNLASGSYQLYVQICQSDGTVSLHKYAITIDKFLWQQWWFWLLCSSVVIITAVYVVNLKRKRKLAQAIALQKEAELEAVKATQQKKLANMQVVTLSSQFRPHFILNALNTIGAQMDDKPEAETVISRLGESINLIFSHAQQQKIAHPLLHEWQLVNNVIYIHQLMYLKDLQVQLPEAGLIEKWQHLQVPPGLLQVPVENALLHGLSNREQKPWMLIITMQEKEDTVIVTITDNGVGRTKAATLSNYRRHGTGTRNLQGILDIVNAQNKIPISIIYKDDIYIDGQAYYGTSAAIEIPKIFTYDL